MPPHDAGHADTAHFSIDTHQHVHHMQLPLFGNRLPELPKKSIFPTKWLEDNTIKPLAQMVRYTLTHRGRHRQKQQPPRANMRKITDLPAELLLDIMQHLPIDDIFKLRLTCRDFNPPASTTIQNRMKCLYIHPSTTSLRTFRDFCNHPLWASKVNKVILLGDNDFNLLPGDKSDFSVGETWENWCHIFSPWPAMFPRSKACADQDEDGDQEATLEVIISSLAKLSALESISFENNLRQPGFNQVTQAMVKSHGRKYFEEHKRRKNSHDEQRINDFDLLMAVVTSDRLLIRDLSILTPLPFAVDDSVDLATLTSLSLTLDFSAAHIRDDWHGITHIKPAHIENYTWKECCAGLLESAYNVERLSIMFRGTNRSKLPIPDRVLETSRLLERTFPKLQHFELTRQDDRWWEPCVQRPILLTCKDGTWDGFLQRHIKMALREIAIDNVLIKSLTKTDITENILSVVDIKQPGMRTSYIVNHYQHHRNCKNYDQPAMFVVPCRAACGIYSLDSDGLVLYVWDMEHFARERGVKVVDLKAWDFGNCPFGQVD